MPFTGSKRNFDKETLNFVRLKSQTMAGGEFQIFLTMLYMFKKSQKDKIKKHFDILETFENEKKPEYIKDNIYCKNINKK